MSSPPDVTALLGDWSRGDRSALDQLLPLVYAELRLIATRQLRKERVGHTLQPTALVHEVYLRLVAPARGGLAEPRAFLRGSRAGHAQDSRGPRPSAERGQAGEGIPCLSVEDARELPAPGELPILALDRALDRLEKVDSELARIVELRAFGGLTLEEAAHVLKVSPSTAKRDWRTAKAWLARELGSEVRP